MSTLRRWIVLGVVCASTSTVAGERQLDREYKADLLPLQRLLGRHSSSEQPISTKMYESGYINTGRRIFWLDNERVLFQGGSRSSKVPAAAESPRQVKSNNEPVYIWNYRTSAIKQYADGARPRALCYRNGRIKYIRDPVDAEPYVISGPLGKEREEPLPPPVTEGHAGFELIRCEGSQEIYEEFARRTGIKNHNLLVLLEQHGVIDRGPSSPLIRGRGDPTFQAKLYRPNSKVGIALYRIEDGRKLPVRFMHFENDVYGYGSSYYPFANVYLFYSPVHEDNPSEFNADWPKGLPYPVHVFRPTGETNTVKLPYGPWRTPVAVTLTRKGIYVVGYKVLRSGAIDNSSGGYLVAPDGRVSQLVKGITKSLEVSPDGCKVAFAVLAQSEKDSTAHEVKVLEFCTGATP